MKSLVKTIILRLLPAHWLGFLFRSLGSLLQGAQRELESVKGIPHSAVTPFATYAPWRSDKGFQDVYAQIHANTLVDIYRCYELWDLASKACKVDGDFLEVGVWRGGTGALLAKALQTFGGRKLIFLADTFTGVVKAGAKDTAYEGGEHADTSAETASELLRKCGVENAVILSGVFPDETASLFGDRRISLLHIDVDVYESARDIVTWATPRLSNGAIVVFDDYGFKGCEGITKLVNELKSLPSFHFIHNLNGHGILIKTQ